ncbi:transglycosylase SLT domain-containing protein [Burkholderia anthina]|uniref:transglycosylase SLT domain-containing protein n=1 Tax=Burkholderia anthina TaxID=179879 RepID=UPI00158A1C47|nr:transglycosylase SLT domain-containing protein [Burkholderia anthina]
MANNFTITISAVDKATDVARKVNKSLARIADPINKLGKETKALGDHFSVIGKMTGITQIGKGFTKLSGAAVNAARSVASVVTPIAALTGAGTVAGIIALATAFGRTATSVKNAAGVLGMPTQQLQAYTGAARLVGLSSDDMSAGLKSLGNVFEDSVTGRNLEAAGAMNQFGIQVHRLKNGSIDTTRALSDIANVIQKMPNAQAQQKFASIFGVEQLLPMLQKGGEGIDKLVDKAKSLGAVMTPEQIAAGERYNEQMVALDLQAEKLKVTFGNALAPAVERVVGVVGRLVDKYGAVVGTKIAEYAERLANWIDRTDWAKVATDVGTFLDKIGGVQTVAIALAAITFATPIAGILSMVTGLVRLATFAIPLAIGAFGRLGKAKVAADAAGAAADAAEGAASAAGKAGTGEAAAAAGKGLLGRLAPWAMRLGLPLWLMTHSEGLNTGEDAYLAAHRAAPGATWPGDATQSQNAAAEQQGPASMFSDLESKYSLPTGLLDSVWNAETSRGTGSMVSPKGAQGHFQFMPDTARAYGVHDPFNLRESATGAAKMYSDLLRQNGGNLSLALAAYNWGQGNLSRKGINNAPAETRDYIRKVMAGMSGGSTSLASAPLYAPPQPSAALDSPDQSAASDSMSSIQHIYVEVDLKNAPPGTTARVRPSANVTASVKIGQSSVGGEQV